MKKTMILFLALVLLLTGCQTPAAEMPLLTTTPTAQLPEDTASLAPTETTEATEPPKEPLPEEAYEFVRLADAVPAAFQYLLLAKENALTGQPLYDHNTIWLRAGTAQKLSAVVAELDSMGYALMVWDGYQNSDAHAALCTLYPDRNWDDAGVRGSAVDVGLMDLNSGAMVALPSAYCDLTDAADRVYQNCPVAAIENAMLLEEVMLRNGFAADPDRWWRYWDTDEYPLETSFDPTAPSRWASEEELPLLDSVAEEPNTLGTIPAGEEMVLLAYYNGYALVEWNSLWGYVPASMITPLNPDLWMSSVGKDLYLFQYPNTGSNALAIIDETETFEFVAWNFKFAQVTYKGKTGYVRAHRAKAADEGIFAKTLDAVEVTDTYTYEAMMEDLSWFATRYSSIAAVEIIGQSEMGLDIPVLRIGDPTAEYHILFQAAIHGREHMTAWLSMALADFWLDHNVAAYGDVCYHIIPMSNPDGVQISQTATLNEDQKKIYRRDYGVGNSVTNITTYAKEWKANALGVDLNQNFDANWEKAARRGAPSSMRYRGESAFCAKESQALRDYTLSYDFDITISYHSEGSILYYNYGDKQPVNAMSTSLALHVNSFTGYDLKETNSCAGYKDWAMDVLEIPSLTIETGCNDSPLKIEEVYNVFFRNQQILPELARWIQSLEVN